VEAAAAQGGGPRIRVRRFDQEAAERFRHLAERAAADERAREAMARTAARDEA
jgi:hypothetical protein